MLFVDEKSSSLALGATLFDGAKALGARVPTSCFGQGKCRECLVEIETGAELLSARAPEEEALDASFRLSCRTRVEREGEVRCHTLRRAAIRIETDAVGLAQRTRLDPSVRRDGERVVRDGEVLAGAGPMLGLALDVGTTTVAVRLHDLDTGALLATQSFENPQRFGGTDVMARIRFDSEHGGRLLQRTLIGYLRHAVDELPCERERIFDVVVAGNTAMRDLFFGLDVRPVGEFPYHSTTETALASGGVTSTELYGAPKKLHLDVHPRAQVYGLPLIGRHVGADAAAALLATGLGTTDELCVLMDIGTNTEVIVGNRERLLAASCPAGPAFEGGAIRNGMPGLDGAIERVALDDDGNATLRVIGARPPAGICGSGLVDLMGELLRTGRMNERGRLADDQPHFVVDAEHDILLTEFDLNELAQAKGANAAGVCAVLDLFGITAAQVDRFYLAGGFARHLDVEAAKRIGLIPDLPSERIQRVGNAALEGASLALLSCGLRRELDARVRTIEHVSLETHPRFFDFFVDGCQFAPFGGAR